MTHLRRTRMARLSGQVGMRPGMSKISWTIRTTRQCASASWTLPSTASVKEGARSPTTRRWQPMFGGFQPGSGARKGPLRTSADRRPKASEERPSSDVHRQTEGRLRDRGPGPASDVIRVAPDPANAEMIDRTAGRGATPEAARAEMLGRSARARRAERRRGELPKDMQLCTERQRRRAETATTGAKDRLPRHNRMGLHP